MKSSSGPGSIVALVCGDPNWACPYRDGQEKCLQDGDCAACCIFFPFFPEGLKVSHAPFPRPSLGPDEEENLAFLRSLRDKMRDWIEETFSANNSEL